jgi:hypothetical protein
MMANMCEVIDLVIHRQEVYTNATLSFVTKNQSCRIYNPGSNTILPILNERSNANSLLVVVLGVLSTPLAGSISLDISQACTAGVGIHVLNILERDGGNETRRLPRVGALSVELVDLLEGESLGLVDHGPDEEDADEAASAPDEEDLGAHVGVAGAVVDHVGGSVTDGEVEKPEVNVNICSVCV